MKKKIFLTFAFIGLVAFASTVGAQATIRVKFAKGRSTSIVSGTVRA